MFSFSMTNLILHRSVLALESAVLHIKFIKHNDETLGPFNFIQACEKVGQCSFELFFVHF